MRSTLEVTKVVTAALVSKRGNDLMQLQMRKSCRKQQLTVHKAEIEGRNKAPQTLQYRYEYTICKSHTKGNPSSWDCWNAFVQRFTQYQAPFDAAAVRLSSVNESPHM